MKKIVLMLLAVLVTFTLVGCKKDDPAIEHTEVSDPTPRAGQVFVGWYLDKGFQNPVKQVSPLGRERKKYYPKFVKEAEAKTLVAFNTKGGEQQLPLYNADAQLEIPQEPIAVKKDFKFEGWYKTPVGKTWNEQEKITFPYVATGHVKLHAHFVPVNQKTYNWTESQTLKSPFVELKEDPVLNPFVYTYSHEGELLGLLKTDLYRETIDWKSAIEEKIAAYPGDYSKLTKENVGKLRRTTVLLGASSFPKVIESSDDTALNKDGTISGVYSEQEANNTVGSKFEIKLRQDLKWEDGTQITAEDFVYTFLQFIDPQQRNSRAVVIAGSADLKKGYKIKNARYYFYQGSKIGFDCKKYDDKGNITPEYQAYLPDFASHEYEVKITEGQYAGYSVSSGYLVTDDVNPLKASGLLFDGSDERLNLEQFKKLIPNKTEEWYTTRFDSWKPTFKAVPNSLYVGEYGTTFKEVNKKDVGIYVKADDNFTVVIEYTSDVAVSTVLDQINGLTLVNKDKYEKSLNEQHKSNYGTNAERIMSYGPFFLKEWSPKAKWVFNKNFDSIASLYTNYKSIAYEVYANRDLAMTAFKKGKISSIGVTFEYKDAYPPTNKNVKEVLINYPTVLLLNPEKWDKQAKGNTELMQDINFRKALFYGFDRNGYVNSDGGYGNKPSVMFSAIHATQFDDDPKSFFNDGKTQEMLKNDLKLNLDTFGFDAKLAKEYFDKAYDAWKKIEGNNETKIKLIMLIGDSDIERKQFRYVNEMFQKVFGKERFVLESVEKTSGELAKATEAKQFDVTLSSVGSAGAPTNLSTEDPLKAFFMYDYYRSKFGNSKKESFGITKEAFFINEAEKIDLRATYNSIKQKLNDGTYKNLDKEEGGKLKPFYEILDINGGYFHGDLLIIWEFMTECTKTWAGNHEAFDGETADRNTVTRTFYKIALNQLPMIPVATRAGYTVRNVDFKTKFPAFHPVFNWGPGFAQYLASDPDFKNF